MPRDAASPARRRFLPRYDVGVTPLYAAACDQRVGWRLCVPSGYDPAGKRRHALAVFVHGTWREDYAWLVRIWCERRGVIALCPLFPAGIITRGEIDNYKFIEFAGIRFDRLLLEMVAEVAMTWRIDPARFLLFGFSGGAQFAHRFALLHPLRVRALVAAAPGSVTLPGDPRPFWVGTGDLPARFGVVLHRGAIARIPTLVLVGERDTERDEITVLPHHPDWMDGANDAGATRIDRGMRLAEAFAALGADARFELVPGAAHDHDSLLGPALRHFDSVLSGGPRPAEEPMHRFRPVG